MIKFTKIAIIALFSTVLAISTPASADDKRLKEIASPLGEIEVLFKNCHFKPEDLDEEVELYKTKRQLEHYYWDYVQCNTEGAYGDEILFGVINDAKESEPMLTHGDYEKMCSKRIDKAQKQVKKLLSKPLEQCEDYGNEGI